MESLKKGEKMEGKIYIKRSACKLFDQCLEYCKGSIYILDVETTGPNPNKDEIVQISILSLRRDQNGLYKIAGYLDEYVKPSTPVSPGASAVNNITNEFLADKPGMNTIFQKILAFMPDLYQSAVMGYCNTKFDNILMQRLYASYGFRFAPLASIDVKKMAEELVCRKDVPEQKLTLKNVSALYGIPEPSGLHNSLVDIYVTGNTAFRLYDEYVEHYKNYENQYRGRSEIKVSSMYRFRKSKTVDYIYITGKLTSRDGQVHTGKIRYSIWEKHYEEVEGDLFEYGDLDNFDTVVTQLAGGNIAKYQSGKHK